MVWYCINDRDSRGESYEINSIINLSIEYEISFIIVITLCFSIECGEMEKYIRENLKEVRLCRILSEDYYNRVKVINVFEVEDLLKTNIYDYKKLDMKVIEQKLFELDIRTEEHKK